jgi:TPR repeat protein
MRTISQNSGALRAFRAAELGDGEATHIVGLMHDFGMGVVASSEEAMAWYKVAAERRLAC